MAEKFNELPDNELISHMRNGDHMAYTVIYNRYFHLMFISAYKKLRDEDLAKDVVQELFIRLWQRRDEMSDTGNLAAYLFVSLRHKIIDHFVHQKVENKYVDFLKVYADSVHADTDYLIREKQLEVYIEKQIQALPKKMRRIFEMSRKDHLNHREIASILETSEYNVAKQISNAMRIIKGKLGGSLRLLCMLF